MPGRKYGYARVSTRDQHPESQRERLEADGCTRVYEDHGVSGVKASRPEWDKLLDRLEAGDTLVCTKLDRVGRSVKHLVALAAQLKEGGIDLRVIDQGIDTSTAAGRMLFHVLAAIAEFEHDLITERTRDGLAVTSKRGRSGGRKPALKPYQALYAQAQYDAEDGPTVDEIAAELGVSRATLYRSLDVNAGRPSPVH